MRLLGCARRVAARSAARGRRASFGRQLEIDVFERGPAHLERVELLATRDRVGGQLVEPARRVVGALDDLLTVAAVADLGLDMAAGQVGGRPLTHDLAFAEDRDAVRELLRLVEVMRREQDRLPELAQVAHGLPRGAARAGVEA